MMPRQGRAAGKTALPRFFFSQPSGSANSPMAKAE
eukprot:CAMPEP_0181433386 /NCGR_PEP_ID=MMETSP1110-20121109/19264_1 /TAXON_ID=174948 /ORGANISM="Symbiodinium sp., Strain CCMP421" /LENGTH=34 /DNA_ID= /DNA_START= /DNA_END= /DNA_ORIENTATION=